MLKGKVAIVTGAGHPQGMGAAIALKLAQEGAKVVITDLASAENQLTERVASINAGGGTAMAMLVDVTDPEQIRACIQRTEEVFGGLDILVNNAGIGIGSAGFLQNSRDIWDLTFAVNVFGVSEFCRAALPLMQARGGGVIINNSSVAGLGATAGMPAHYVASKHAVIGLTKSIAQEFGKDKIRCVAICPGSVKTQMYDKVMGVHMERYDCSYEEAEVIEAESIPMGYTCESSAAADVVAFLASPAAQYVTGIALPIAGGMSPGL